MTYDEETEFNDLAADEWLVHEDEWRSNMEALDIMDNADRVHLHPNQLEELGCGNPEGPLNELVDLKHGYQENV